MIMKDDSIKRGTVVKRNILHILSVLFIPIAIFYSDTTAVLITSAFLLFYITYLLFKLHPKLPTWKKLEKYIEQFSYSRFTGKVDYGLIFLGLGIILTTVVFSNGQVYNNPAYAAIVILAFGDGFSAMSVLIEKRKFINKNTSIEGTLIGFVTAFVGASLFVPIPIALIGAFVGMFVEAFFPTIDDNLIIPILSAFVMSLMI